MHGTNPLLVSDDMVVGSLLDLKRQQGFVHNGRKMVSTDTLAKYYIKPDDILLLIDDVVQYIKVVIATEKTPYFPTYTTVACYWDDPCHRILSEILKRYPAPTSDIKFEINDVSIDPMKSMGMYYDQLQVEFAITVYYPHGTWFRVYINGDTEPRWLKPSQTIYDICIDVDKSNCVYNGTLLTLKEYTLGEAGIIDNSQLFCF